MAQYDRHPSPRDDDRMSPWAVAVAAAGVLAGLAYLLTKQPRCISVTTRAHASDGMVLPTRCACLEDASCLVTVRNAAPQDLREITDGSQDEVSTTAPVLAREVCLHIRVQDGDFDSVPHYEDGRPAAHVRSDRELIVFLGDMQPSEEVSLRVRVRLPEPGRKSIPC